MYSVNLKMENKLINDEERKYDNPRAAFYKRPIKRDNYRLEISGETPQEIRRQRILQFQKRCRSEMFNAARGILEEALYSDDECEENMQIDEQKKWKWHSFKRHKYYANRVMMSEWMVEVPQDFLEKWFMVPCPQGIRCLLVACRGRTRAYNRRGYRLGTFQSALPGGNLQENKGSCTIVDCIWVKEQKIYYVLDVLAWSNQPFLNCDTEFRFYWLQTQFNEIRELQEESTPRNKFPILLLPRIPCNSDLNLAIETFVSLPPVDGLLFYHKEGQYTKGRTPLVTWLKLFMLPEVLNINVAPPFDEKPNGYIDFEHYICREAEKTKTKRSTEELMELVNESSQ